MTFRVLRALWQEAVLWAEATDQAFRTLIPHPSPGRQGLAWCVVTEALADLSRSGQTSLQEWCRGDGTSQALCPPSASSWPSSGLFEDPVGLHWEGLWRRVPGALGWGNPLVGRLGDWRET